MKKITSLTLLVLTLAFVPLVFGAGTRAAQAAPPTAASGSFSSAPPTNVVTRSAGPNTIITDTFTGVLSGTFSGTSVFQERYVLRADGSFIADHAVETFTGTVNGVAGTATFVDVITGDTTSFHGHFVVVSGTGGLANLRGQGTFEGSSTTGVGTYTAQIQIHP